MQNSFRGKIVIYPGGKHYLANWLIPLFPSHEWYFEVFGGSATFLFKKPRSRIEIYNDIDDNMYTFFKVLRDNSSELAQRVKMTPVSRSMFNEYIEKMQNSTWKDEIDRAIGVLYLSRLSFSGVWQRSKPQFGVNLDVHCRREFPWSNLRENIEAFAKRFDKVTIEHLDYKELLKVYDGKGRFFYFDPPYLDTAFYTHNFEWKDHVELAEALKKIKGKFMVSYTKSDKITNLYKGFTILEKDFFNSLTNKDVDEKRESRTEIAIMNYDPSKDKMEKKERKTMW